MNKLIFPFLFIASLFITACNNDEPTDQVKDIMMSVSEEPGVMFDLFDDEGKYPMICLRVMDEDFPGEWRNLSMTAIEGFEYEVGHMYTLRVRRTILANPPADASAYTYKLLTIHEDRIWPPENDSNEEIIVDREADIPYAEKCPYHIYDIYRGVNFMVDNYGGISHADYDLEYKYDYAAIRLEFAIPKESPNFLEFNRIEKMAYFAYILSPLTDEVEKVRLDRGSLYLKNFISQELFNEIVTNYNNGSTLVYDIVLANIHGYGLQKVKFTISKK